MRRGRGSSISDFAISFRVFGFVALVIATHPPSGRVVEADTTASVTLSRLGDADVPPVGTEPTPRQNAGKREVQP
jgi:hypothetical protein